MTESKLKTILLGTEEQRIAKREEFKRKLDNGTETILNRIDPSYILRHAVYVKESRAFAICMGTAINLVYGAGAYGLGTLIGECLGN
jgi:hypothetical protein